MSKDINKRAEELFREVMAHCRTERKKKTSLTVRSMAHQLDKTENFVSAVENGREIPSLKTFLQYLLISGFDVEPLKSLMIGPSDGENSPLSQNQKVLIEKIYDLNDLEVQFLAEQSTIAQKVFRKRRDSK